MGIGNKPRGRKQSFNGLTADELINLTIKGTVINDETNPVPVEFINTNYSTSNNQDITNDYLSSIELKIVDQGIYLENIQTNTNIAKGSGTIDSNTQRVVVASDQIVPVSPRPNTTGVNGTKAYSIVSKPGTNADVVKYTPGNLYSIIALNLTSTVKFLKLYQKNTLPNVGVDKSYMIIPIPANTQGAGLAIPFSMGIDFSNGIAIAITANVDDYDNTGINARDCVINLTFG